MTQRSFCQGCKQKHDCQDVYRQMGEAKAPSVVVKVIVAFLLPLVVFIVSLMAFGKIFAKVVDAQQVQTVFSLLSALLVTFIFVVVVRRWVGGG